MTETREAGTTTTTDTGEFPSGRNSNPNPFPNSTVDPIYACFCTAKIWTVPGICFKIIILAFAFGRAAEISSHIETAREISRDNEMMFPPEAETLLKEAKFSVTVTLWTSLPLLVSSEVTRVCYFFYFRRIGE